MTDVPPEPPRPDDEVAAYILDGLDRQNSPETLRSIAEYAEARADRLEALDDREVEPADVVGDDGEVLEVESASKSGATYTAKVSCGKDCSGCPHGPYRYRSYRENGETKTEYLGKA